MEPNPTEIHSAIKLGIEAHCKRGYVARQPGLPERHGLFSQFCTYPWSWILVGFSS